jgi:signal transduction histidine kinase
MELRTQTSLLAALIALAIALSVLLRPRRTAAHWSFGWFSFSVAAWYLSTSLLAVLGRGPTWTRINLVCAVLVPLSAVGFFRSFAQGDARAVSTLLRVSSLIAAALVLIVLTPRYADAPLAVAIFLYLVVLLAAALALLWTRARFAQSRFERARLRFLVATGALAAVFTLADFLPLVGLDIPPVGSVLTLVFLYILSQSIVRSRLIDLYELAGRLGVLTALSFTLATVFWALLFFVGRAFFLHSVAAALVVLLLYDPVRLKVEETISQFFFRERYDLEQNIATLRRRLALVLEAEHLTDIVMPELERSRRATHAALYLVDADMRGYRLVGHLGPAPIRRIEVAAARPLLDALRREVPLVVEQLERELTEHREAGADREAETCHEILQSMEAMHASLCVAIAGERQVYGMLCVRDERLRDAYSPEEAQLFLGLANQIATTIQNSRLYQRMKERDRLAMMGEMAAGLAHEIRNPLGAIKASAQYLGDSPDGSNEGAREFLDIIVEEADRLNRVVSSFLEYANPAHGEQLLIDVNAVVERTAQVLDSSAGGVDLMRALTLAPALPQVRIDPERLRQVLINLIQNAAQAIEGGGTLHIETGLRELTDTDGALRNWVEIQVTDTGPGIPEQVLKNLFEPFVTTRQKGTGLGLAISQRIVKSAGGSILVRTRENQGSTFTIRLPVASDADTSRQIAALAHSVDGSSDLARAGDTLGSAREAPSNTGTKR